MSDVVLPALRTAVGEEPGCRYEVCYNPEFMREGSAAADYFNPQRIVIGERYPGSTRQLTELYAAVRAPIYRTSLRVAETLKHVDNSFHALKVAFATRSGATRGSWKSSRRN